MPSGNKKDHSGVPDALLSPNRRDLLKVLGIGGATTLAGCFGDAGVDNNNNGGGNNSGGNGSDGNGGGGNGNPQMSEQYTGAFSSAAETLNFVYNTEASTAARIGLTLDGAWAVDTKSKVFPLWCDYTTDDSKTYTITVRDGLNWGGDYGQMTADDWVYMINKVFKSDWAAYPSQPDWVENKVTKTGKMTFDIELPKVDPSWPLRPVMWGQNCAPKQIFQKYVKMAKNGKKEQAQKGLQNDKELNNLTYTGNLGPYNLKNWEPDNRFVGARNKNYYMQDRDDVPKSWQSAPYFKTYSQKVIPEQSSRLQALKTGEIDTVIIPPNRAKEFKSDSNIDTYIQPQPYLRNMQYNMRANGWLPFRMKEVRQAFMMAIDKKKFTQNVFRGYAQPAYTMQPKWSDWYVNSKVKTYGKGKLHSVKKARTKISDALSKSNYNYRYDGDQLIDQNGNQVNLTFIAQSGQPLEQTIAEVLAQAFRKLGVKISIKTVQGNTFVTKYTEPKVPKGKKDQVPKDWPESTSNPGPRDVAVSKKSWDMALIYEFNTYPRTPSDSKVFFYERGPINYYGYVPSDGVNIKKMYEKAATTTDEKKRQQLFAEIFGVLSEEQPFGFLAMQDDIAGYRKGIVGPVETFGSGWNGQTYYRK